MFASYARVHEVRALIGYRGEELNNTDKLYMEFGRRFEENLFPGIDEDRTISQTLDLGWKLLEFCRQVNLTGWTEIYLKSITSQKGRGTIISGEPHKYRTLLVKDAP